MQCSCRRKRTKEQEENDPRTSEVIFRDDVLEALDQMVASLSNINDNIRLVVGTIISIFSLCAGAGIGFILANIF